MYCLCGKSFNSENDLNFHIVTMCQYISEIDWNIPDVDLNISLEENFNYSSSEHENINSNHSGCSLFDVLGTNTSSPTKKYQNTDVKNLTNKIKRPIKKTKHPNTKIYKCLCGKVCDTKKKLGHHKKNSCFDPNISIYKCICKKKFITKRGYVCHQRKSCKVISPKIKCVCKKINCIC